jgi:hypothetical protein
VLEVLHEMTGPEWALLGWTLAVCLLGMLLPWLGNQLGRLFLGEDPVLVRWRQARAAKKAARVAQREARKARKAAAQ